MTPSGTSIWLADRPSKVFSSLKGKTECDVVIVGAGITGLTAAYRLCLAGRLVIVLEQGRIGDGTSGRTTAHLSTMYDGRYSEIEKTYDRETAKLMGDAMSQSVEVIEQISAVLPVDCGFKRLPGYLYAEEGQDVGLVEAELAAAQRVGLEVEPVTALPLPFPIVRGIKVARQAQMHPAKYLQGLAEMIVGTGKGQIYENTRVTDFASGQPLKAVCEQGAITARDMILATHTPLGFNLSQALMKPMRSYALALPMKEDPPEGLFWDTATPYHYIRSHSSGSQHCFVIGGADHVTGHLPESDPFESLKAYAAERFGSVEIAQAWSAQYYEPEDLLPFIGKTPLPLNRHFYIATGFSGDGMTLGTLAGTLMADLILGHENRYEALFHPLRLNVPTARSLLSVGYQTGKMFLKDRFVRHEESSSLPLETGEGGVVGQGTKKLLEYRNDAGIVQTFEASCPHMGCLLHWNERMKSFDCPCHGSRFDGDGRRIEGPALRDLTPVALKRT